MATTSYNKKCKYCNQSGFKWSKLSGSWKLIDEGGHTHICKQVPHKKPGTIAYNYQFGKIKDILPEFAVPSESIFALASYKPVLTVRAYKDKDFISVRLSCVLGGSGDLILESEYKDLFWSIVKSEIDPDEYLAESDDNHQCYNYVAGHVTELVYNFLQSVGSKAGFNISQPDSNGNPTQFSLSEVVSAIMEDGKVKVNHEKAPQKKEKSLTSSKKSATIEDNKVKVNHENMEVMMAKTRVKLRDATELYQPVYGTSKTSKYFVVGIFDGLKVAARCKGGKVSVRVEGESLSSHQTDLSLVGFNMSAEYGSFHIDAGEVLDASKVIGAVLFGIGKPSKTLIPNVQVIFGHGG